MAAPTTSTGTAATPKATTLIVHDHTLGDMHVTGNAVPVNISICQSHEYCCLTVMASNQSDHGSSATKQQQECRTNTAKHTTMGTMAKPNNSKLLYYRLLFAGGSTLSTCAYCDIGLVTSGFTSES